MNRSATSSLRRIAGDVGFVESELQDFTTDIRRFRAGQMPEAVFLERRLRFGVYGQRQDGVHMMRSKHPLGLMTTGQLRAMADVAEHFGHGVAHITTRQDIQVHFVALENTPGLMRTLDAADMTSREACGNVVRNVTATELSGVDPTDVFDVTGAGMGLARFLLRHPEAQSLGRKVKVHLASGPRWNLSAIHDLGATAAIQDGVRGFHIRVGGGLGAVPHVAPVLYDFIPEAELLPLADALLRVFGRHGEKKNRARARLKFLVAKWGLERFRDEVERVRAEVEPLAEHTAWMDETAKWQDRPAYAPAPLQGDPTNVFPQKQDGYYAVKVRVPRGDLSPDQLRGLAQAASEFAGEDTLRLTVDQAVILRWVPGDRVEPLRRALDALGLGGAGAGGLADAVTCPGADTCKLGITAPRRAARKALDRLDALAQDPRLQDIRIKISGCFNGCAQHHVADIGFYGAARTVHGRVAPHYIVLLGGVADGTAFGTTVTKVPAARLAQTVETLTGHFLAHAGPEESFRDFTQRVGRKELRELLRPLQQLPPFEQAPELYREPGSTDDFAIVRGTGECAGEVVDAADFHLADAERASDAATAALTDGDLPQAALRAREAMFFAARALLANEYINPTTEDQVVQHFQKAIYATGLIYEGVGHYFLTAANEAPPTGDRLRRLVLEAELFVEEAHSMTAKRRANA